jgi:hypothetical protein
MCKAIIEDTCAIEDKLIQEMKKKTRGRNKGKV